MSNFYQWMVIEFKGNDSLIKSIYEDIPYIDQLPAANQWQYLFPVIESYFNLDSTHFAILKKNNVNIFIMPISLFKVSKFIFNWKEVGFPFHNHINLIRLHEDIHSKPQILLDLISEIKQTFGDDWSRFSIRNIEDNHKSYEYCGHLSYFDTLSDKSITDIISKKHNRNLNRISKRIQTKFGEVKLTINSPSLQQSLNDFIALEERSWKGLKGVAISSSETLKNTYINIIKNFSASNMVIAKLESNQEILASALCFRLADTLYIHKISHNKDYPEYSPGSILVLKLLEHCLASPEVDKLNLVTSPQWAKRWHPKHSDIKNIVHYNDNITGRLLKIGINNWRKYKPSLKAMLRMG